MNEIIYKKVEEPLMNAVALKYTSALIDATVIAKELLDGVEKAYLEIARHYDTDTTSIEEWKQNLEQKIQRNDEIAHCLDNGEIDFPDEYLYVQFVSGKNAFFAVSEHGILGKNKKKGIF